MKSPTTIISRPASVADVVETICQSRWSRARVRITGGGSRRDAGSPSTSETLLDLSGLAGIHDYDPAELVLTAGAGTSVEAIESTLAECGQMLAFEPARLPGLAGPPDAKPTLGGIVSSHLCGSRRVSAGSIRDHVLGVEAVSGRGERFKAGGRVIKNVTGFDLSKLMAGSWGTLAVLTRVTLKVLPAPQHEATLIFDGLSDSQATSLMSAALHSPFQVSCAAHVPGRGIGDRAETLLRIEGFPTSVADRAARLASMLDSAATPALIEGDDSTCRWRAIRDVVDVLGLPDLVWRIVSPPANAWRIVETLGRTMPLRHFYDWGGGLIWLALSIDTGAQDALVRSVAARAHASAMLLRAPAHVRRTTAMIHPAAGYLETLSNRLKASFDPDHILEIGRMELPDRRRDHEPYDPH